MIDLKDLRHDPDHYRQAAQRKRIEVDIDRLLELDAQHRQLLQQHQQILEEKNRIGQQIGQLAGRLKKAPPEDRGSLQEEMTRLQQRPTQLKELDQSLSSQIDELRPRVEELLYRVPQPPDEEVPDGEDDSDNVEIHRWGQVRDFSFKPQDHVTLGTQLGMIDIERGVKLAGSRSYFLSGAGCLLHQAVLRLAFDMMVGKGFVPLAVPLLVREEAMVGTGFFPLGREQTYALTHEQPPAYLVGTSEVPLTAYHSHEVLDENQLPRKYVAQSACFRREAGTYGKDTAGLYRIHQFDKVEQVIVCRNDVEESKKWHLEILGYAEAILQALELPYRVVQVCTGELGQGQAAKYDIETWMPSRGNYCETHSASRFYDFQARRLGLRYRDKKRELRYCQYVEQYRDCQPTYLDTYHGDIPKQRWLDLNSQRLEALHGRGRPD